MKTSNSKLFLTLGIILAVFGGITTYSIIDKMQNLVPVVVATQNIEPRTQIKENMLRIDKVPALGRNESSVSDINLVVGGYSTSKIYSGQPIIQPMVAKQFDEKGGSDLSLAIPDENLRVVGFPISKTNTLGGTLKKGDFVDIISNATSDKLGTETSITKVILQGVEIFSISYEEGANVISFMLTLEQAEIVQHAYEVGTVNYALNPGNAKASRTSGVINKTFCERYNFNCSKK